MAMRVQRVEVVALMTAFAVILSGVCYKSLPSTLGNNDIAVQASTIRGAGLGAFARRTYAEDELIGTYKCTIRQRNDELADHSRSWVLNHTHLCDGSVFPGSLHFFACALRPHSFFSLSYFHFLR